VTAPRRRSRTWLPWLLFWAGLALFFASQSAWREVVAGRGHTPLWKTLLAYGAHWLAWGAMSPCVVALARRWPLVRGARLRRGSLHVAAAVALSFVQLVVMQTLVHAGRTVAGESPSFAGELRRELGDFFHLNLLTYALIFAASVGIESIRRSREQELLASRLAEQLAEARLAALRMQIHPHFLFNSLHAAAELVHEDPALAERTLLRLADLLRRALRVAARDDESLAESLEFVDGYLELEGVRLEGRLQVSYEVPDELLAARVPTLLLQPLVENAVRHGVARRRERGEIALAARAVGDTLEVVVANELPTAAQTPLHAGAGIGLANVRSRLAHLFGDAASLAAGREGDRYVSRVRLPLALAPSAAPAGATLAQPREVPT
jgi:two-component system LytT family sensor kinase